MFERFTEAARRVVVLAQDEARTLGHNYIGTEHLLLGLLRAQDTGAGQALASLGFTLEEVRAQVARIVGRGTEVSPGQIPFTPRAKKVLELSLQEALSLGHNHIGTEHVLLGLVREGEGVAARVLADFADRDAVVEEVLRRLGHPRPREAAGAWRPVPIPGRSMPRRVADYTLPGRSTLQFVLGWSLFGVALGIGILVGWLIWG